MHNSIKVKCSIEGAFVFLVTSNWPTLLGEKETCLLEFHLIINPMNWKLGFWSKMAGHLVFIGPQYRKSLLKKVYSVLTEK